MIDCQALARWPHRPGEMIAGSHVVRENSLLALSIDTRIGIGVDYAFGFFLCDLPIPGNQVVTVEVVISDATAHWEFAYPKGSRTPKEPSEAQFSSPGAS